MRISDCSSDVCSSDPFRLRLIVGTGKYKDFEQNAAAVAASGAQIVTVAVRRVNVSDPTAPMLTDYIDPKKITYLPKRSEEHPSEIQSLMRLSFAVFCLKKTYTKHT